MNGWYEIYPQEIGFWSFSLRSGNGAKILNSKHYETLKDTYDAITKMQSGDTNLKFIRTQDIDGRFYFLLIDQSGETTSKSRTYKTIICCNSAIATAKANMVVSKIKIKR